MIQSITAQHNTTNMISLYRPYLLLCVFLCTLIGANAQLGRSLQPSWIHLDKAFYVAGDQLGFQLYLAPEFAGEDILVQSILFGANGEPVLYNYWRQGQDHVQGQFVLPESLPTGWYYLSLRAWDESRKTERVLQQAPLAIYNDQNSIGPEEVSQREPARETAQVQIPEKELQIEIAPLPAGLAPDQAVQLDITITDRRGRPVKAKCSVSINDWGLLSTSLAMGMDNLQTSDSLRVVTPDRLSSRFYWQGEIVGNDGQPGKNQTFMLQAGQEQQQMGTDERGRFVFRSNQRMVNKLQFEGEGQQQFQFQPANGRLAFGRLFYSPAAFRYLELNRQRKTIREAMGKRTSLSTDVNFVQPFDTELSLANNRSTQDEGWRLEENVDLPAANVSGWYPALETTEEGRLRLNYGHGWERTAYRVDIVAQDEQGRRGRQTLVYRVQAN